MALKALDLFCGAGGASMGLHRAGYDVTGVDINPKLAKRYPFRFIHGDAMRPPVRLEDFDLIWASPPCQRYSLQRLGRHDVARRHPDLVGETRYMLNGTGVPWVIENVPGAPIRADVVLTGPMFGLRVHRRRHFEVGGFRPPLAMLQRYENASVRGGELAVVAGQGVNNPFAYDGIRWVDLPEETKDRLRDRNSEAGWQEAMGIDWMGKAELKEAIPPDYAEFIARAAISA